MIRATKTGFFLFLFLIFFSIPISGHAEEKAVRFAFIGLHGGVFEQMKPFEKTLGLRLDYLDSEMISSGKADLSPYRMVFMQHLRSPLAAQYRALFKEAKQKNSEIDFFALSPYSSDAVSDLVKTGLIQHDKKMQSYYAGATDAENLRRLLLYTQVNYLGKAGKVPPPMETAASGLYYPGHESLFPDVQAFLSTLKESGLNVDTMPRVAIPLGLMHLKLTQPAVIDALIRRFEKEGILAAAILSNNPDYEKMLLEFKPDLFLHPYPGREPVALRKKIGAPHLQSLYFRQKSIDEWRQSTEGLDRGDFFYQIVSQELLGTFEPMVGSGTEEPGGSDVALTPIPERIEHIVKRSAAWIKLARTKNNKKRIAIIYYDREMGKAELMRGTATGMFMNAPRSLVKILERMKKEGYAVDPVPDDEDELIAWMMDSGRQIGIWAPGVLDKLAKSGEAILIPVKTYVDWFETKVPEAQQKDLIKRWGPPPGKFLVWERPADREQFIVIPRIQLGNVTLLPQPLRGEAHDTALIHDRRVPPPHNYLATYFWLQEGLQSDPPADAIVHFGTHGTEFLLPGKAVGLDNTDWPDMVIGNLPNINPWIINNLGESSPVRRRANALIIDHLTPPSVNAELADELLNLHNDIDKWDALETGALKEKFLSSITEQVRAERLDQDLMMDLADGRLMTPEEIRELSSYLHTIYNETTPVNLHVFGEPPREDLLVPTLVTAMGKKARDALGALLTIPPEEGRFEGDREKYLRQRTEEVLTLVIQQDFSPVEALQSIGGKVGKSGLPEALQKGFDKAFQLKLGFEQTGQEMDNLMLAFSGGFIPPGPGNSPDRNPASVPTGRNMYVVNPQEIPSRPSWEIGKTLVDQLLAEQLKTKGRYPAKIGFNLSSFASFQDYGVMEAQILYLMGIRPVWDAQNLVADVELIPVEDLGRPRVDVFIAAQSYYRDMLPSRMRLLDKAVRLAASVNETGNAIRQNSLQIQKKLEKQGIAAGRALSLGQARIFGFPPGQTGSAGYYYLVEKSGEWGSREELINNYLEHVKHVYTEGIWGEDAPETYDAAIQGTEIVLRSWSDRSRSPLANKYTWYIAGSLSLAIEQLTGKEPEFLLSDVRDPDQAQMVDAEEVLRRDYRVRLFNRKWIEGMMKEGYAGADQVAVMVSNTMGWTIMRKDSVADDVWEEIVNVYLRDSKNLAIREWFEAENPFAFQEVTEILLESARKGYWKPSEATLQEVAEAYARSVARHGEGGGLRGGGNVKLEAFLEKTLQAPGTQEMEALLKQVQARAAESAMPAKAETVSTKTEEVEGQELAPVAEAEKVEEASAIPSSYLIAIIVGLLFLILLFIGYRYRREVPSDRV